MSGTKRTAHHSTGRGWEQLLKSALFGTLLGILIPTLALGQTATLLPNAKQQYVDDAGVPVANGSVTYYVPGTSTKKTVWQNSNETTPQTNPVLLDAAGRPQPSGQTYGDGQYRQQVKDVNNVVIWDAVTSSTGSGSGGGGTNIGDGTAVGHMMLWAGLVAPTNYLFSYGQAVSRVTYSALLANLTLTTNVVCASGTNVLSGISDTTSIKIGAAVEVICMAPGTTVTAVATNTVTVSNNASSSAGVAATFFNWGGGDGSTTFNLPDMRGRTVVGRNNMGGTASSNMTTAAYGTSPNALGAYGGNPTHTLVTNDMPPYTPAGTITNGTVTVNGTASNNTPTATGAQTTGSLAGNYGAASLSATQATSTFLGTPLVTTNNPLSLVQSSTTLNVVIKAIPDINISVASCLQLADAGTACQASTGTSGHVVPFLDGTNTFGGGTQTMPSVAIGGGTITGMPNPTVAADVANKAYVDSVATGLNILPQTGLATAAVLPNTPTYANGASGVGATLTAGSNTTLTVDGTAAPLATVVLVKNQAAPAQNGIYTVTTAGSGAAAWVLTRATYFDQAAEMKAGSYTLITGGVANINSSWTQTAAVATVGTDPSNWAQFSAACSTFTSAARGCAPATGAVTAQAQLLPNATWAVPTALVVQSRAAALSLNLTGVNTVQTLGYTVAGDGGGGVFQKLGAGVPFQDTYINNSSSPPTLVGGSGYVNGPHLGVPLGGGTGLGCMGAVTVAGGAATAVSLAVPCAGYKVGDVLSAPTLTPGSGFTWTITAISTPQASFTDAVGNNFQFVTDQAAVANILQFGGNGNWVGTDGSATNNAAAIWSAGAWSTITNGAASAQVYGNKVVFPKGAYMTCGAWNGTIYNFPVAQGVHFSGAGIGATTLVECAADASNTHYIELCDSNAAVGQFGCKIEDMTINLSQVTTSTSGFAAIYSNSGQQFALGEHLEIDTGGRGCIKYEIGKGGAANDVWIGLDCEQPQGTTNTAVSFNASSTQHYLLQSTIGCGGTGGCSTAISHSAGRLIVDGLDVEAYVTGLLQNVTIAGNQSVYRNVQQNSNNCSQAISLVNGNIAGNILFENVATGCPKVILNGQSGGTDYNGTIRGALMCVNAGACTPAIP